MLLKEIATIQLGYQFRERVKKDESSSIRAVQMKDIDETGELIALDLDRVDAKNAKDEHFMSKGIIIFCSKGNRNIATVIRQDLETTLAVAPFFIIRPDSAKILPEYLAWYINQSPAQKVLSMHMEGTMLRKINKGALENLEIKIPQLLQQERIVALDALSRKEQLLLREIAQKRKQMVDSALMQQVLAH